MIDAVVLWLRSVLIVSFLATLVRILVPNTPLRPFVRLVMGFVVLSVMLQPLIALVGSPDTWSDIPGTTWGESLMFQTEPLLEVGRSITEQGTMAAAKQMEQQISRQLEAVLSLLPEVEAVNVVALELDERGVRRIEVDLQSSDERADRKVRDFLSKYLGIAASAVKIQGMQEGEGVWTPGSIG